MPSSVSGHIDIKVASPSSGVGAGTHSGGARSIRADGEVGEQLVVLFEQQAGRYPLRVGHITGYLALGCDVLSFSISEDREKFLNSQELNSALVERFIEAKARSAGIVELTGNEWNAARQWNSRYFVYRFERDPECSLDYLLTSLRDPQAAVETQIPVIQLSLDRAQHAERFKIRSERIVTDTAISKREATS